MKLKKSSLFLIAAAALSTPTSYAATALKSDGTLNPTTDLTSTDADVWLSGSGTNGSPTTVDTAQFDSFSLASTSFTLNSDVTWNKVNFSTITAADTISGSGTLNLSGVDTAAGQDLVTCTAGFAVGISNNLNFTGGGSARNQITSGNNAGALTIGATSANTITTTSGTLWLRGTSTALNTVNSKINISGILTKTDASTWVLNGANTIGGGVNFAAGKLFLGNDGALGTGIVNVNNGTNATAVTLGSASGTRTIANNFAFGGAVNTMTLDSTNGALTLNGTITESGAGVGAKVTVTGTNTVTLSGANNFTGATTVNGGILRAASSSAFGVNSAVTLANTAGVILDLNGNSMAIGSLATGGTTGGNVTLGSGTLTTGGNSSSTTYAGAISGTGGLTKVGIGTQTLTGANTYSGTTTVNGGILKLDFSAATAPVTNIINNTANNSALSIGGTTLQLTGKASTTNSQQLNGLTLTGGSNAIMLTANATANPLLLTLGGITRTGGTVDFTLPTGTQSGTNGITTTSSNDASGILGTWATVGGADFATVSGGNIVAYTGYTDVPRKTPGAIANGASSNVRIVEGTGTLGNITMGADATINTLNQSISGGTSAATIDLASHALAVNTIVAGTGAGALTIGLSGGTSGTLKSAGTDLIVVNNAAITVNSVIADGTGVGTLVKNGTGNLTLSGSNIFTGATTINAGTLTAGHNNALGTGTGAISIAPGAMLQLNNGITLGQTGLITMVATGNATGGRSELRLGNALSTSSTDSNNIQLDYTGLTGAGNAFAQITGNGSSIANAAIFNGSVSFAASKAHATGANNIFVLRGGSGNTAFGKATGTIDLLTGNSSNTGILRIVDGNMNWELSGSSNRWTTLDLSAGTVSTQKVYVGAANTLSTAGVVTNTNTTVGGIGVLNLSNLANTTGYNQTIAGIQDGTVGKVAVTSTQAATLIIGGTGIYSTTGAIGGSVALNMNGSGGKQTLAAANSYTSGTTVTTGTLALSGTGTLGSTTNTLAVNGGTLDLGTTSQTVGTVTLGGGTISNGTLTGSSYASTGGTISATLGTSAAVFTQNSGTTFLTNGANAYSGGTVVNGGILRAGTTGALGSGQITLTGGSLSSNSGNMITLANATVINGDVAISTGGFGGINFTNTVDLGGATRTLTIARTDLAQGVIFGNTVSNGGIVKSGAGALTLSGTSTYTGNTTVNGGILSLATASLADASTVSITSGATLDLNHSATDTIDKLFIDGVQQAAGLYKSSTAAGAGTVLASLTGDGKLDVTSGPSNTFDIWMSTFDFSAFPGADLTANGDADGDGIKNVLENVFGTAPNAATTGLTQISATGSTLTFKHPLNPSLASDVTYSYQWSSNLGEWKSSGQSNTSGTTATISAGAPVADVVTVTTTITAGPATKLFVRLNAVKVP